MKTHLTLSKKLMLLVAVPLIFELGFLVALGSILRQVDQERQQEAHAREVSAQLNILLRMLLDSIASGVMFQLTSEGSFTDKMRPVLPALKNQTEIIKNLTKDTPHEHAAADAIDLAGRETITLWEQSKALMQQDDRFGAIRVWAKLKVKMKDLSSKIDALIQEQEEIQRTKSKLQIEYRKQVEQLLIAAAAVNLLVAFVLAVQFNRQLARRLQTLADNTVRLALGKELNPRLSGRDELAQLDSTFRKMASTLADLRKKEHAIVDNALEVICSIDARGAFSNVNPASSNAWGYAPEELLGRRLSSILCEEVVEETLKQVDNIVKNTENGTFETRIARKDHSIVEALFTAHWSKEEKVLFCVAHDISERKRIENMKRDFIAMVSHDLRTPLTTIQLFHTALDAGAYGQLNDRGAKNLQMVESEVDRLIALVNDLLDIERLESGKMDLDLLSCSTDALLKRALDACAAVAANRNVQLSISDKSEQGLVVPADEDRMVQALLNLVANAVKFSPEGETVTLQAVKIGDKVEISVMDRGRGVPDNLKESIFDRFKQVEQSDAKGRLGSGLGLAISKAIVERHGGTIGVTNRDGDGSIFWIRLYMERDEAKQ